MHISCSICKELFFPQSEVCGTKCGHLYHEQCIKKWQELNGSCPKCRTKIKDKPHRIYFDIEDSKESEAELDADVLRYKIDCLQADLSEFKRKNDHLEAACAKVEKEIDAHTKKIRTTEATIRAMKQKIEELIKEKSELEPLRHDNETLKIKLKSFANLQTVVQGTENEVKEMLNKTPVTSLAVHQLCVFVEALKYQLRVSEEKHKKENDSLLLKYKAVTKQLQSLTAEKHQKKTHKIPQNNTMIDKSKNTGPELCNVLKRQSSQLHDSLTEPENISSCLDNAQSEQLEMERPAKMQKRIINNLDRVAKKDISSDSSDVEIQIYPGPSKNKVLKTLVGRENKSIFRKLKPNENQRQNMSGSKSDVAYDIWGASRNILALPSASEELKLINVKKKKTQIKKSLQTNPVSSSSGTRKLECYFS